MPNPMQQKFKQPKVTPACCLRLEHLQREGSKNQNGAGQDLFISCPAQFTPGANLKLCRKAERGSICPT